MFMHCRWFLFYIQIGGCVVAVQCKLIGGLIASELVVGLVHHLNAPPLIWPASLPI